MRKILMLLMAIMFAMPSCEMKDELPGEEQGESQQQQSKSYMSITVGNGYSDPANEALPGTTVSLTPYEMGEGMNFIDWMVSEGDIVIENDRFVMPDHEVRIAAVFEQVYYSVTVENGTTDVDSATMGTEITLTPATPEGSTFTGWTVLQGDVEIIDNKFIMPAGDVHVKAVFDEMVFLLTVDGGTADPSGSVPAGTTVRLTPGEAPAGKEFTGWTVLQGDVEIVDNKFIMPAGDVHVKAVFDEMVFLLTVDGGTADPSGSVLAGTTVRLTPGEAPAGKEFTGWTVLQGGVEIVDNKFTMPSMNVEIAADFTVGENGFDKITDPIFKEYCERFDTNGDDYLSRAECAAVKMISLDRGSVRTLVGIEIFPALTSLSCFDNKLSSLDLSYNTSLTYLSCMYNNNLTSLDVSGCSALTYLACAYNSLTSLNISGCSSLTYLACFYNNLTSLNVDECPELEELGCSSNNLTSLNVDGCTELEELDCSSNNLTSLNVDGCTELLYLNCNYNNLTSLNVYGFTALEKLYCASNNLTSLSVDGCTALERVQCNGNKLSSLDVSSCISLSSLTCDRNVVLTGWPR